MVLSVVSGVWLFVAGYVFSLSRLGILIPFRGGWILVGRGGTCCDVWHISPFLGCVAVPVLGPCTRVVGSWVPGDVECWVQYGAVVGGVELLAEGCWPVRVVFGCGCDRVGCGAGMWGAPVSHGDGWVLGTPGRTCRQRWSVFGAVLVPS